MSRASEYRAIPRGIPDQPEYQSIGSQARLVYLTLRISLNGAGIAVEYPEALAHQLKAQTGLIVADVKSALSELERAELVRRDGNVLWIVHQLADDPLAVTNVKHRKSIQSLIDALPKNRVVAQFILFYREWFNNVDNCLAYGYSWAEDSLSLAKRYPSASNTTQHNNTQHNNSAIAVPAPSASEDAQTDVVEWPKSWAFDSSQAFLMHGSVVSPDQCGKHTKALKDVVPWSEWLRMIPRMVAGGEMEYGLPAALRRYADFRDVAQPDPNRELTLEEAMAL